MLLETDSQLEFCPWSSWVSFQDVAPNGTTQLLKGHITDLITKGWNVTRFMEEGKKITRQSTLRRLSAEDGLTKFGPITGPHVTFTYRGATGNIDKGGF